MEWSEDSNRVSNGTKNVIRKYQRGNYWGTDKSGRTQPILCHMLNFKTEQIKSTLTNADCDIKCGLLQTQSLLWR
jgi:hypothetical protein